MPFIPQMSSWMNVPQRVQTKGGMSYTKAVTKRRKYRNQKTSFRRKVIDTLPAKHNTFWTTTNMAAQSAYMIQPTRNINQGTSNQQRLGDDIFLEALKLKGTFNTATNSNAYQYRIIVGYTGEEIAVSNTWSTTGLSAADMYQPDTFDATFLTGGAINKKAVTVLLDETIDVNSQVEGAPTLHGFDYLVPLKQKFLYQSAGSTYGKTKNLFVWVVGYSPGLTGATVIGTINIAVDLIFKD
jgi:hypothetical protein